MNNSINHSNWSHYKLYQAKREGQTALYPTTVSFILFFSFSLSLSPPSSSNIHKHQTIQYKGLVVQYCHQCCCNSSCISLGNRDCKEWASISAVRVELEVPKTIDVLPTSFPSLTFYLYCNIGVCVWERNWTWSGAARTKRDWKSAHGSWRKQWHDYKL